MVHATTNFAPNYRCSETLSSSGKVVAKGFNRSFVSFISRSSLFGNRSVNGPKAVPKPRQWTQIFVLSDIAALRPDKWIATHCHHGRALIMTIRQKLSPDAPSIFQIKHDLGAPKKVTPEVMFQVKELTHANRRMSMAAISQVIKEAPALPSISVS
jgi:hypothetical protein